MAAAPRYRSHAWRDIGVVAALVTVWIAPWFVLTVATWIAGGHPSASPVAFIDPVALLHRVASGSAPFEWWVLVAPTSSVVAWQFWTALALIVCVAVVAGLGTRTQVARASGGPFRWVLPDETRVVRVARWARAADLHSLRGRPGHGGTFLLGEHRRRRLVTQPETSHT